MAGNPGLKLSSLDYYHALFNTSKTNAVLLIAPNGIILDVNRAFLFYFGYDRNDLIGRDFSMLYTEDDRKKDLPYRELRMVLDGGQSADHNYLVNKNQVQTWVSGESLLTGSEDEKYILKIIQNVHTQKESDYSIIRLNNFNENILGTIEDAVIVLDKDLKVLKANRSFCRIFNVSAEQATNIDFQAFINIFDVNSELYNVIINTLRSKFCINRLQLNLKVGDKERRTYDISCTRLTEADEQSRVLLIFHDVTAQKLMELQREDILNFVAHELRTPLTNVILSIGMIEEMLKEKVFDEFAGFIDRAKNNAQRLKKLINELYKSTKLISGNFDPENAVFDFPAMVEEAVQSVRQAHPQFDIILEGDSNISLFADRDKLIQVITNYLTNAIKYSGGNNRVHVRITREDNSVVLCVSDQGKGIPARELPYIFNRFYRAKKTKDLEGLGLGLFLSRQIIEAHNGRTWAESEEGKGSAFYFSIPFSQPPSDQAGRS